ncbi:MAG: helix-turn-helix transcriptional regulator [Oscillospiraceae bacterium]|nr:helix-turn-helix transcriptional regulator [Oscillospiraceae bacterium]
MVSKNLKDARKQKSLSQEEVAEIVNTSRSNISKYETGLLEPNLQTLKRLCELYKVSADKILEINIQEEENEIIIKKK